MTSAVDFDDDYVAKLLADDAKKTSSRYAVQGLSAFLPGPRRRAADAPRPNTRFLGHIVREVDSHNAALKAKEELEASRRLQALRKHNDTEVDQDRPVKRRKIDESDASKRSRMFKDILGAAKSERPRRSRKDDVGEREEKSAAVRMGEERKRHVHRASHQVKEISRKSSEQDHRRSRSRSPSSNTHRRHTVHRVHRIHREHRRRRSGTIDSTSERDQDSTEKLTPTRQEPLHSATSPIPSDPIRIRGRGAHRPRSAVDDRFREDYDPSQDVSLDSDHDGEIDDWDSALEAMRDRAKYKRIQASRLRDVGFSEQDISKWEKGTLGRDGRDDDVDAVKWKRAGETREWDAGK